MYIHIYIYVCVHIGSCKVYIINSMMDQDLAWTLQVALEGSGALGGLLPEGPRQLPILWSCIPTITINILQMYLKIIFC